MIDKQDLDLLSNLLDDYIDYSLCGRDVIRKDIHNELWGMSFTEESIKWLMENREKALTINADNYEKLLRANGTEVPRTDKDWVASINDFKQEFIEFIEEEIGAGLYN